MPNGLMDMFQPSGGYYDLGGKQQPQMGFGDLLAQRQNSLVGLGLGLMAGSREDPYGNALRGYTTGSAADQNRYQDQARLKLAQQQANKEPEAIRQLRAAGIDPKSPEGRALLFPKQDEWHAGKVTIDEQDYPYRANLRSGQYEWGPLGAPPSKGARPGAAMPSTTGTGGVAGAGAQEQEPPPKPAGYDTWLPSVRKEYDKTMVQQQAKQTAAEPERKAQILESGTVALREIDAALKQSEAYPSMVAGPFGNAMKGVWGSQATDVDKRLNVIKANIAFDKLQAMRRASPTGGALGNVSDKDMALLQSSLASLDQEQSAPQFVEALRNVQTHYRNVLTKIQGPSSGSTTGQTSTGVRKYNPQTGMIE